jgi:hypothetical protein
VTAVVIDRSPSRAVVRTRVDAGAVAVVATVVVASLLEVLFAIGRPDELPWYRVVSFGYTAVASLVMVVVARAVLRHDPRHPVGWLLGMIGASAAFGDLTNGWTVWELPGSLAITWVDWCLRGVTFLALAAALMLSPTGHPVSPRWHWLLRACAVLAVVGVVAAALSPWPYPPYPNDTYFAENPLALEAFDGVGLLGDVVGFLLVVVGFASLVVRFRRAEGVERDQLKLIAFAGVTVLIVMASAALLAVTGDVDSTDNDAGEFLIGDAIFAFGVTSLAAAIGLGIVRYRLYGLDRLMSRTLAYLSIVVVLGAGYVAIVVVTTGQVTTGGSIAITALAAGLVAAVAQPLRAKIEAWLERRIFQSRATASDVMNGFARDLAATPTSTNILGRIAEAALALTGARASRVEFIRHDGDLLTATVGDRHIDDWDTAIRLHEGPALLGALVMSAGDVGPSSRTALDQLTSVSTAALATLRLQHELDALYAGTQAGNRELAASRRRLIDAAAREREELRLLVREQVEPDIAQLRGALTAADYEGAPSRTGTLVETANRIATTVRSIARGVLPSVLTDHGLVAAIRADLRRVDAVVALEVDPSSGSQRLPTEVETVAYLCCRAVLRDADRSLANSVAVRIELDGDVIRIDARHRGSRRRTDRAGTTLTIARDRVHSLGGVATVVATDDTVGLHAELPIAPRAAGASRDALG